MMPSAGKAAKGTTARSGSIGSTASAAKEKTFYLEDMGRAAQISKESSAFISVVAVS